MADTLWNEVMYTDVMQTSGFVVDYAICTTYSLDMPTLLSVPFLMGSMSELSETALKTPHVVLEAINRAAGKFAVFCNAGCIAVPRNGSKVYALLEKSVVQITLPKQGDGFINFHPKVWIIKETNPDERVSQMKVVVMSRNLTNSNDLDIVCELTGTIGYKQASKSAQEKHKPLIDFIEYLANYASNSIHKKMDGIVEDLKRVERFELDDPQFKDYDFFPMGIDGYNGMTRCFESDMLENAAEVIVISPFVNPSILARLAKCRPGAKKTLITRHKSIQPDILPLFNDGVFAVKEVLTDQSDKDVVVDIHEKVYFIRNYQKCEQHLYLGSTNATRNGFDRNVEFLLRLTFAPHKMSYSKFRSQLINDSKDCMFEQVYSVPEIDGTQEDNTDERLLRQAISLIKDADVIHDAKDMYHIAIHCKKGMDHIGSIDINPLYLAGMKQVLKHEVTFTDIPLLLLSEFFVLTVGDIKRVVKIKCQHMPEAERDKAVFRSLIDTKSKFINYLAFMLSEDAEQFIAESSQLEKDLTSGDESVSDNALTASLYEDMVRTAYRYPERIAAIRQVIDKADKKVLPDNFEKMYAQFEIAIKKTKRYEH
jgi:hypothetical protein